MTKVAIKRALISVYDKTGVAELAQALAAAGVEIVSTGTPADLMAAAVLPVLTISTPAAASACASSATPVLS